MSSGSNDTTRTLERGIVVFRWVALIWMATLAFVNRDALARPGLAWAAIGVAGAWTAWLTAEPRSERRGRALIGDLLICGGLIVLSGLVVHRGSIIGNAFFASAYPVSAALAWGVAGGPASGAGVGLLLGGMLALARPINGVPLAALEGAQVQSLATGTVLYAVAGVVVGLVSGLLERSRQDVRLATEETMRERERSARLAEREAIARQIHDSVLQTLSMINKRGRELAGAARLSRKEVAGLAELASAQEAELRSLIMREPDAPPVGIRSLRDALEAVGREATDLRVEVSTVGPVLLERGAVEPIAAAVRQALRNVAAHAGTDRATVFAEIDEGRLVVSVRDDGAGFVFDADALRVAGKAGILKSVIGRVEELGGRVRISSAPGNGTIIEMEVPVARA